MCISLLMATFVVIALTSAASPCADIHKPLLDLSYSLLYCPAYVVLSTLALFLLLSHLRSVSTLKNFYAVACLSFLFILRTCENEREKKEMKSVFKRGCNEKLQCLLFKSGRTWMHTYIHTYTHTSGNSAVERLEGAR